MTDNALAAAPTADTSPPGRISAETGRRRTFAVISHPDAGKSTLTEALALHARAITEAGAVHGKAGRRATVSDWMEMEKARGISITSTVLQFPYRTCVINLLDTPGHADFSEDTYRVLTAVDSAVMLIDAAKGLEPQTLKLFQVCKHRRIPIITVINKWDRPGRHALELMDEIHARIGLRPTPLTWPVGIAGDFKGVPTAGPETSSGSRAPRAAPPRPPKSTSRPPTHTVPPATTGITPSRSPNCCPPTAPTTIVSSSSAARPHRSCSPRRR